MKKAWHIYVEVMVTLFLIWFTQSLVTGGNALNGYADSTGYYFDPEGYIKVSAVTYYINLFSLLSMIGIIPVVIKSFIKQVILLIKVLLKKPQKSGNRLEGLYRREGLALSAEFPYYIKHMVKGNGSIKERYRNMLTDMKITGYEVIDAGLGFYSVCLMMMILIFAFGQKCGII